MHIDNLAIISSPFQLLNLKELIDERNLDKVLIIAIFKNEYDIKKIKAVSNFTNLKISRWVKSSFIMTHVKLFFIGLKLNNVKNFIFSSLFDNRMLLLSKLTKYQNIILIDMFDEFKKNQLHNGGPTFFSTIFSWKFTTSSA